MKFILLFIDGFGIGINDQQRNPCTHSHKYFFNHFQDQKRTQAIPFHGYGNGLDANLDVEGLPQSATGQATLFTGMNAAKLLGYHLNGFPNEKLRRVLTENSLLKKIKEKGLSVDFINTFRPSFFERFKTGKLRHVSCSTQAALAAEIPLHHERDLRARRSIYHDLTNEGFIREGYEAPLFSPQESGKILAQAMDQYDFVLAEYFLTDFIGHAQDMQNAQNIIKSLEDFIESVLFDIHLTETTMIIVSDHGNFEDLSTKSHTRNSTLFLTWGKYAQELNERCKTIQDPYHVILEIADRES